MRGAPYRLVLALAALAIPSVAVAQTTSPDVIVGNWRVSSTAIFGCQALTWADEGLKFTFFQTKGGDFRIILENEKWQFADGERYAATISWDEWGSSQALDIDASSLGNSGLLVFGDAEIGESLRQTKHFWLRVPGVELDREFTIDQADLVLDAFDKCLTTL